MDNPQGATNPLEIQLNLWEDDLSVKKEHNLSPKDRQFLIAGLIGEYQSLVHDDLGIDPMTPEEHHRVLLLFSDAELLEDSDLIESPYETAEEFYDTHSSFCPYEFQVN